MNSEAWREKKGLTEFNKPKNRKAKNAKYYQDHKDSINRKKRERYHANKDKINKRRRKRYGAKVIKQKYLNLDEKDKGLEVWQKMVKEWHERYD